MAEYVCGFDEAKVESMYPEASMVQAMEIWSLPKNKKDRLQEFCDSGDYLASKKVDGYFYWVNKTPNHNYLFSRKKSTVTGLLTEKMGHVPHIEVVIETLPADTLICGEIYIPGKTSKAVTSIMGCKADKAVQRQKEQGFVHYYIYDVVLYDGENLKDKSFQERYKILQNIYNVYFSDYDYIEIAENIDTNIYETAVALLEAGEEGMVLRKKDHPYECGKRTAWSSIKIKQEDTLDVVITGFCNPTKEYKGTELNNWQYWYTDDLGENNPVDLADISSNALLEGASYGYYIPVTKAYYYGWKNAVEISAYDDEGNLVKIGTISSGLTDEMRAAFAANPELYLNKVIEVKCMSLDSKEKTVRHGYFLRWRDDKNPEDCKLSLIFK